MNIPIIRIPFDKGDKEFIHSGIEDVLNSGNLTMGKYTKEFEGLMCEMTGAKHSIAMANCTCALETIIRALEIEGKSIIVPTNTFLATALGVLHSGNKVIFVDSKPDTFSIDPDDLERRITEDTAAVILVHIGGIITADYERIQSFCDEKGILLIEDCAHAHGCSIDGRQVGTLGVAGSFSFFPTKVLVTGEGGMITTNNTDLYKKMMMIRNQGKNPELGNQISELGGNYRISEFTAVLGVQQVRNADDIIKKRQAIAGRYDQLLKGADGIKLVSIPDNIKSSYYKYLLYLDDGLDRNKIKQLLKEEYSVSLTGEVYASLCHSEPIWEKYTYSGKLKNAKGEDCSLEPSNDGEIDNNQTGFPGSEYISKHHICLPLYPDLTDKEIDYVVCSLKEVITSELKELNR
tara:strand:- start:270 stop:1484 length:1215 start_codon:yes stop_codon:yes gene_type:complete